MTTLRILIAAAAAVILTSPCDAFKTDIKVKYYGTAILRCHENVTVIPATKVFWITPDATVIDQSTPTDEYPENVQLVNGSVISMLNVTKVDDDAFGYYTCVMINSSDAITLARWGLNVDGADFSELEEQYRENAVIGAVAAAVMLVLVGGACVIWHFRYSKRARDSSHRPSPEDDPKRSVYDNAGFDKPSDIEMVETQADVTSGQASNGAATADSQQNGGSESF